MIGEDTLTGIRSTAESATKKGIPIFALLLASAFVLSASALAGNATATCDMSIVKNGVSLFDKLTMIIPLMGGIYFIYNSFQYGRGAGGKSADYKEARQRVLIWGIIVPAAGNIIIKGVINFVPGVSTKNNCLTLTTAPVNTVASAVPVDALMTVATTAPF